LKKSTRKENEQIWKAMVERSRVRPGSLEEFCKAEGVSPSAFGYWQQKLRSQSVPRKKTSELSPFAKVEILEPVSCPTRVSAPNAKWVAEIILHLHRGMTA
jgi:hypothetical protein